jgi:hypothetical protein
MTLSPEHVWAVVPLKCFAQAKARLAPALTPADRQRLAFAMADDVLATIRASGVAKQLCLLSDQASAAANELAACHGALALLDHDVAAAPGLNEAIGGVAAVAVQQGASALLVVHADLPLLSADALRQRRRCVAARFAASDARPLAGRRHQPAVGRTPAGLTYRQARQPARHLTGAAAGAAPSHRRTALGDAGHRHPQRSGAPSSGCVVGPLRPAHRRAVGGSPCFDCRELLASP